MWVEITKHSKGEGGVGQEGQGAWVECRRREQVGEKILRGLRTKGTVATLI